MRPAKAWARMRTHIAALRSLLLEYRKQQQQQKNKKKQQQQKNVPNNHIGHP